MLEIENDCSCVYTAIGPEGIWAFYQHFIVVLFSIDVIIISSPFIFLKPLDEMSPRLVGVFSHEPFVDITST